MYTYIRLVVLRNRPSSIVRDPIYRDFSKYDEKFFPRRLKKVLFTLAELVERKISQEVSTTKGTILQDYLQKWCVSLVSILSFGFLWNVSVFHFSKKSCSVMQTFFANLGF